MITTYKTSFHMYQLLHGETVITKSVSPSDSSGSSDYSSSNADATTSSVSMIASICFLFIW
ncbi:MAG: hypothetical protein ACKPKO_58705, partial [Candidatus Fonsibacter sp.]